MEKSRCPWLHEKCVGVEIHAYSAAVAVVTYISTSYISTSCVVFSSFVRYHLFLSYKFIISTRGSQERILRIFVLLYRNKRRVSDFKNLYTCLRM